MTETAINADSELMLELERLRERLREAEETLEAIRSGEVDALVVSGPQGEQVYTLAGADRAYRFLMETLNEGAATLAFDGTILYANGALGRLLRAELKRIVGSAIHEYVASEDKDRLRSLLELGTAGSSRGEVRLRAADGAVVPASLSVRRLEVEEDVPAVVAVLTDLTEQKRAKEELEKHRDHLEELVAERTAELRKLNEQLQHEIGERRQAEEALERKRRLLEGVFEHTHLAQLVYLDRDFNFVRVNDAYARACGRNKDEFIGRNHFELYPSEAEEIFKRVRETGEPYMAVARPFVFPDHPEWGETYWDWTLTPVKDAAGEIDGFVFSLVDVTARIRQQRQLEEASKLKDEFLSLATHELKTPMTSIKLFSELAMRRPEKVTPEFLGRVLRQADQLVRLIDDLLDVSRLQLGRMPIDVRRFDLAERVKEFCDRRRPLFEQRVLSGPCEEDAIPVEADPMRLEQVLSNLLDNALKYSSAGSSISVRVSRREDKAVVEVEDQGIGISAEDLPYIFERFYKPSGHNAVYSGLGVGLHICREIVERHGGCIWAESEEGKGSTFHVELPLASQPATGTEDADSS